jgi:hypothetical protein
MDPKTGGHFFSPNITTTTPKGNSHVVAIRLKMRSAVARKYFGKKSTAVRK